MPPSGAKRKAGPFALFFQQYRQEHAGEKPSMPTIMSLAAEEVFCFFLFLVVCSSSFVVAQENEFNSVTRGTTEEGNIPDAEELHKCSEAAEER